MNLLIAVMSVTFEEVQVITWMPTTQYL
jgi:hypothetical protein